VSSSIRDDDGVSNPGGNATLDEVLQRSLAANPARRRLMLAGLGAAVVPFLSACGGGDDDPVAPPPAPAPPPPPPEALLGFTAIATSSDDDVKVPAGYVAAAFIPWGEPINDLAPSFKADAANSAAEQEQQVGDNHDGMAFFGFNTAATPSVSAATRACWYSTTSTSTPSTSTPRAATPPTGCCPSASRRRARRRPPMA
jgi:secreted PhoX family phosphatase